MLVQSYFTLKIQLLLETQFYHQLYQHCQMKENPLKLSQYRVNFRYTNSPSRKDTNELPSAPPLLAAQLPNITKEVQIHKIHNNEFSSSKTSQSGIHTDQTLKKEGHSLEAVTLRKQDRKGEAGQASQENDFVTADADVQNSGAAVSVVNMLKEEIRYMRRKLIQAQNAQKELKLEFELYKTSTEQPTQVAQKVVNRLECNHVAEIQMLKDKLKQKDQLIYNNQKQKESLSILLVEQSQKTAIIQNLLKDKQEQNKQLTIQTRQMYNQIQMRCSDLNTLNQDLLKVCQSNQLFYNQNNLLKDFICEKQAAISHFQRESHQWREKCSTLEVEQTKANEIQNQEIVRLQLRLTDMTKQKEEVIANYQANIICMKDNHKKEIVSCKQLQEQEYGQKLKEIEAGYCFTTIEAQALSTDELQKHLSLLKSQPQQLSPQEYFQAKQEIQGLKQELLLMKSTHQQQLQTIRNQYQSQMSLNNEEYTHQLMIYMKEVDILMEEMAKYKQQKQFCEQIIEEQPEQENEYDDEKIKNDLKLYGDDSSDIYQNPPINIKKPSQEDTHEFMLNEIIDLDSKINNYITNFNRKRETEYNKVEIVNDQ